MDIDISNPLSIVSIIIGLFLILGILFFPSSDISKVEDPKINLILRGAKIIRKIIIPVIAIFLLFSGTYFLINSREESNNQITVEKMVDIVSRSQSEKEFFLLGLDFNLDGKNENGAIYKRGDSLATEIVQKWDSGILRYITKDKNNYVRLGLEVIEQDYKTIEESKSDEGNTFVTYQRDSIFIITGVFANSQEYVVIFADTTNYVEPEPIITFSEIVGKWGRVQSSYDGSIEFYEDGTMKFTHSTEGTVTGNWKLKNEELIIHYNQARDAQFKRTYYPHKLSEKSEIISITSYNDGEINGQLKGTYRSLILKKY